MLSKIIFLVKNFEAYGGKSMRGHCETRERE